VRIIAVSFEPPAIIMEQCHSAVARHIANTSADAEDLEQQLMHSHLDDGGREDG